MRTWMAPIVLCLAFLARLASAAQCSDQPAEDPRLAGRIATARSFVQLLTKGDFAAAHERFADNLKGMLTPQDLGKLLTAPLQRAGAFRQQLAVKTRGDAVFLTDELTGGYVIQYAVVFDDEDRVVGFGPTPGEPASFPPPEYARPDRFREQSVTIGSGEWQSPGTLTRPVGDTSCPAVVLVPGSGELDRDETIGPNKAFRDLAWGLGSRGIAVLRYEKRTRQHPKQWASIEGSATLKEEAVDDAFAAVSLLQQTPGVDAQRVFVLGHSQGAFAAPRIAQLAPSIAGIILLAGNSRPLEDVMLHQKMYLCDLHGRLYFEVEQLERMKAHVAKVEDPALSLSTPADELPGGGAFSAAYWLDLRGYHPADITAQLPQPVLVLRGENDWQITAEDFEGWRTALAGKRAAMLKQYPGLNHLFMPGVPRAEELDYAKADHVSETVIADIADWIKKTASTL